MEQYRLAKFIARAGLASRREAEELIREGRVTVNGAVAETLGIQVTENDKVTLDGARVRLSKRRVWMFHKPRGFLTTHHDPDGRPTIFSLLPKDLQKLKPIGRLDMNTEGLLLLTNDGDLARYMEHPKQGITRSYRVRVYGTLQDEKFTPMKNGWSYKGMSYGPTHITVEKRGNRNSWLIVQIQEGKYREIRFAMDFLNLKVDRLIRTDYGPFSLGDLPQTAIVEVSSDEITTFMDII